MAKEVFTKSDNFRSEYCASIVRVGKIEPVEGSDFLGKTLVFGTQIVVRKDLVHEGDIMGYAANETQLNGKFLSVNNLYEIGERNMNANADEVNGIMKEYEPIKAKCDAMRSKANELKSSMSDLTKRSAKINRNIEKGKFEGEQLEKKKADAERYTEKALSMTTEYAQLKQEIEKLVKDNQHIVDDAKKLCGFFSKQRRVRCIMLKGAPSFGFLFSIDALKNFDQTITDEDIEAFVGHDFDTVNGELFIKVYVPPLPKARDMRPIQSKDGKPLFNRMVDGEFKFHYESENIEKHIKDFNPDDEVTISVKVHGTSACNGNLLVKRSIMLPFYKKWWNKIMTVTHLGRHKFAESFVEYGPVFASRKVILNQYEGQTSNEQNNVWKDFNDVIFPYIPEGMTVYGEIVGYKTGTSSPIQKFYDYGCSEGENKYMPYRISTTDRSTGKRREWEVTEVYEWTCELLARMEEKGDKKRDRIMPINILYNGKLCDMYPDLTVDENWHDNLLQRMKNDHDRLGMEEIEPMCKFHEVPREGVCIRKVGDPINETWKLKTSAFKFAEAVRVDAGEVDMEMQEGYGDQQP